MRSPPSGSFPPARQLGSPLSEEVAQRRQWPRLCNGLAQAGSRRHGDFRNRYQEDPRSNACCKVSDDESKRLQAPGRKRFARMALQASTGSHRQESAMGCDQRPGSRYAGTVGSPGRAASVLQRCCYWRLRAPMPDGVGRGSSTSAEEIHRRPRNQCSTRDLGGPLSSTAKSRRRSSWSTHSV